MNVSKEDELQWKTTSNRRLPQISKVKYLSTYWPPMEDDLKWKTTSNIKSNNWSDLFQILNWGLWDQSKLYKCFKWKRHTMEDNIKWKTTSNIKNKISQQLLVGSSHNFELRVMWPKQTLQMFQMKTTSNWKQHT